MSAPAPAAQPAQSRVWEFPFDGIERITPIKGPMGHDQIEIMVSSAGKVTELVLMCQFTETNPRYSDVGFGSNGGHQLTLYGGNHSHSDLLDILQSAIIPNKDGKVFRYTLIR